MSNYHTKFIFDNSFFYDPVVTKNFVIYQIADLYCEYDTTIDPHEQNYFEISAVENGKGYMGTNDVTLSLNKGDVYLSFMGDIHRVASDNIETMRYFCTAFDSNNNPGVTHMINAITDACRQPETRLIKLSGAASNLGRIVSEFYNSHEFCLEMIDAQLMTLLISLYRSVTGITSGEYFKINNNKNITYFIVNYINNNLSSIKKTEDLARMIPYNYAYAAGIFKKVTGKTINCYLLEKRMEYARQLLREEGKSVAEVSELLGYSSPNNFNRAFRAQFGVSPITCKSGNKQ